MTTTAKAKTTAPATAPAPAAVTIVLLLLAATAACRHGLPAPGPGDVPPSGPIVVPTDDGVEIHGDYYGPGAAAVRAPTVLLLHMYSHDRHSWAPVVPALHAAGYAVLAIDLRGHGESTHKGAATLRYDTMMKDPAGNQFLEMWRDVAAARAWLASRPELDPARLGLVAASVGTSVALDVLAREPTIKGAVLMTPGVSYFGFPTLDHARKVVQPLLIVAATEERAGAEAVAAAHPDGAAERKVVLKEGVGHGTKVFPVWPEVKPLIVDWVTTHI